LIRYLNCIQGFGQNVIGREERTVFGFKRSWFIYCSILAQTQTNTICRTFDRVRISNSRITAYRQCYPDPIDEETNKKRIENLSRGEYNGYMSDKTKIKVRDYLHNWIGSVSSYFAGRKQFHKKAGIDFVFVTLTLPCTQNHEDAEIKKRALKPFLQQLERKHNVRNWLWVAEPQKNGNIHFHIIVDRFIEWQKVRKLWNGYMNDLGYIQDYRDAQEYHHRNGFNFRKELRDKWSYGEQVEAYIKGKKTNWSDPNTTDVHKIRHVKNLPAYITKYICKSNGSRPIEGRLWGCSDSIRNCTPIDLPLSSKLKSIFQQLADEKGSELFKTDFNWTLWRFDHHTLKHFYPVLGEIWANFVKHCMRMLYPITTKSHFFDDLTNHVVQQRLELVEVCR